MTYEEFLRAAGADFRTVYDLIGDMGTNRVYCMQTSDASPQQLLTANPGLARADALVVFRPFTRAVERRLARHVEEVRRLFDWPGIPYHDAEEPEGRRFNRWCYHNLPMLVELHHQPSLIARVARVFGRPLKPSYAFLSMYGRDGVCPEHTDRPQCEATVDYMISTDGDGEEGPWPLYVEGTRVVLQPGEAVIYSGTRDRHHRPPMTQSSATYANLAFFHFVPTSFVGSVA